MNAILQAQSAYAATGATLRTGRQAEHQVIATVTARLGAALQGGRFDRIAAALHDNRRLWTRLAADVADPGNALPQRLRAQIFYLAEFTQAHSRRVLRGEADLQALIDVNAAVMRGLGATPGSTEEAPGDAAPALSSGLAVAGGAR